MVRWSAIQLLLKAAELDPNTHTHTHTQYTHTHTHTHSHTAIQLLLKAAELDPNDAQTWYILGRCQVTKLTN